MAPRRRGGSPLAQIIRWFLSAPLTEAEQALETAQTIVEQKREGAAAAASVRVPSSPRRGRMPLTALVDETAAGVAGAVVPPAPSTTPVAPRQRARRSDAGKPKGPRRRRGPAAAEPVTAAAEAPAGTVTPIAPARAVRRRQPVAVSAASVAAIPQTAAVPMAATAAAPLPDSYVPEDARED